MTRFRLTLEYDGRPYSGWQRQVHTRSVQQAVEDALATIIGGPATVHAAGRTDAGVHARAMTAHVDIDKPLTAFRLGEALNARLRLAGEAVAVLDASPAPPGFHARFSCVGRAYVYHICCRRAPLTFEQGLVWRRPAMLDVPAMQSAARLLVGRHDFTTFRSVHCQAQSPEKTLDRLDVAAAGDRIAIHASARSFLHHQVRSMVGALVLVGEGVWTAGRVGDALAARNRSALGLNAPPDGLWFIGASYPDLSVQFTN
jgi:tRNA pseudouridine38-40 synthase